MEPLIRDKLQTDPTSAILYIILKSGVILHKCVELYLKGPLLLCETIKSQGIIDITLIYLRMETICSETF